MKGKRIFLSVIITIMLLVTAVIVVAATSDEVTEYTGTVESAVQQIATVDSKGTVAEKILSLDKILAYITTVDPLSEGYADLIAAFDAKELEVADIALDEAEGKTSPADKEAALLVIVNFLKNHEIIDEREEDNFFTGFEACKTETAEKYLEAAGAEGLSAKERHAALDALNKYCTEYAPVLPEEFGAQLSTLNLTCANQYCELIAGLESNADRGAVIRQISLFIKEHAFDTAEGYDSFLNIYEAAKEEYLADMEEARDELYKLNYFTDLDKAPLSNHDFTPSDDVTNPNNKTGALLALGNIVNNQSQSFIGKDFGMDGDNGYYTVRYEVLSKQMGAEIKVVNISSSAVFEFDITTFGTLPVTEKGMINLSSGAFSANGATWTVHYLSITGDGHIVEGNSINKVLVENAIVKGEWTHVSIVVNYDTAMADIYVDYSLVKSISVANTSKGYVGTPPNFSFTATAGVLNGEFNLDNVKVYQGHAPRDLDFFTNSTDDEKFIYYVNQIDNEGISYYARKIYYDNASRQVEKYYDSTTNTYKTTDEKVIEAVNKIVAFGTAPDAETPSPYKQLTIDLSNYNLEEITKMVVKVESFARQESTQSDRNYFLGLADSLLATSGSYILDAEALGALVLRLNTVRMNLSEETLLNDFVAAVADFYAAASVDAMQKAYEKALALYNSVDPELATSAFPKFKDAYSKFEGMEVTLHDKIIIENSKRLVACISFVSTYTPETWDENYDYIITYVLMAREIIESGLYDPFYKNCDKVIENFAPMSEYFYERRQEKFLEHIISELDRAEKSDKYFEKLGICIKLDEYVVENNLEGKTAEMDELVVKIRAMLDELKSSRDEYEITLKENTEIFVEMCKQLVGSIDYVTMKRVCAEAAEYYYTMDVSDASAQDAISIYVARCNEIDAVEEYAEAFKMEVTLIGANGAGVLEGIVSASKYIANLEFDVEGVKEAVSAFEEMCTLYDSGIETVNSEVLVTYKLAVYTSNSNDTTSKLATIILDKAQ